MITLVSTSNIKISEVTLIKRKLAQIFTQVKTNLKNFNEEQKQIAEKMYTIVWF